MLQYKFKTLMFKLKYVNSELEYRKLLIDEWDNEFRTELTKYCNSKKKPTTDDALTSAELQLDNSSSQSDEDETVIDINKNAPHNTPLSEDALEAQLEGANKNIPEGLKKLYRSIAFKTHPDRLADKNLTSEALEELHQLYLKATSALDNQDFMQLINIAAELDMDDLEPSPEIVELLERQIKTTTKRLKRLTNCVGWMWGNADDGGKQKILKELYRQRYQ